MSESPKKTHSIHRKISYRSSQIQLQNHVLRVVELFGENYNTPEIVRKLCVEINKSERQIASYVTKALAIIKQDFYRDANIQQVKMLISLRADLKEAYRVYNKQPDNSKLKVYWYKIILETKDRIAQFSPVPDTPEKETTIHIEYKKLNE